VRLDARTLFAPLLALLVLIVVLGQTLGALRASGAWARAAQETRIRLEDPYARLDGLLAGPAPAFDRAAVRDPFAVPAPPVATVTRAVPRRPTPPPPPPRPVLTSIVWDNDPRATVRWEGRDYSVRENSLFADFRVTGIRRDQVVLERGGERLVLRLPQKGEQP
jgi:hypothetical protein